MIKTVIDNKITPKDIIKSDFIHHIVIRDEVENMDFRRIKETLKAFEETGKQGKNKLMITFMGYAYFGHIRTLIPTTCGQHFGIIRTA